jgi:hypothetical protein
MSSKTVSFKAISFVKIFSNFATRDKSFEYAVREAANCYFHQKAMGNHKPIEKYQCNLVKLFLYRKVTKDLISFGAAEASVRRCYICIHFYLNIFDSARDQVTSQRASKRN